MKWVPFVLLAFFPCFIVFVASKLAIFPLVFWELEKTKTRDYHVQGVAGSPEPASFKLMRRVSQSPSTGRICQDLNRSKTLLFPRNSRIAEAHHPQTFKGRSITTIAWALSDLPAAVGTFPSLSNPFPPCLTPFALQDRVVSAKHREIRGSATSTLRWRL